MTDLLLTQKLSTSELSQKILEMAATGVYRESIFEAFESIATKKQSREAIAHAKRFGLYSVASLRDPELGTYYQLDRAKYQSLQHLLHAPSCLGKPAELTQRINQADRSMQQMLIAASSFSVMFIVFGLLCWASGWPQMGIGLSGAGCGTIVLWQFQRYIVKSCDR